MKRIMTLMVVLILAQMLPTLALAKERKPSATLVLTEGSVAAGIGWNWGSGVLTYRGKKYPFKVEGLSLGGVGITKARATGNVYSLSSLAAFTGTYSSATAEATLARGGGATAMQNENGVVVYLYPQTKGLNVQLGGGGVKLTIEK